ncbi:hypothetical protein HD806DRAFT_169465 [Xylariaceae sp. AK1471]|nr:hypothetical protein HD806DRAFT_169465 [Xylariaceae sp. AK1471]
MISSFRRDHYTPRSLFSDRRRSNNATTYAITSCVGESLLSELHNSVSELLHKNEDINSGLHGERLGPAVKLSLERLLIAIEHLLGPVGMLSDKCTSSDIDKGMRVLHCLLTQGVVTVGETGRLPVDSKNPVHRRIFDLWEKLFGFCSFLYKRTNKPRTEVPAITIAKLHMNKQLWLRLLDDTSLHGEDYPDGSLSRLEWAFRMPKTIPYIKRPGTVFLYPFADVYIRALYRDRFAAVANIFSRAIAQNDKLSASREWVQKIGYHLAMCGADMWDAQASIVVFCPGGHPKKARQLMWTLSQNHIQDQYAYGQCEISYRLFIWAEAPRNTGGTMDTLDVDYNNQLSLCGSPVRAPSGVRLSTVACILKVGLSFFALTSAHPLESETELASEHGHTTDDDSSLSTLGGFDYDFSDSSVVKHEVEWSAMPEDRNHCLEYTQQMRCSTVLRAPIDPCWSQDQPNLDWALLKIEEPRILQPNAYHAVGAVRAGCVSLTNYIEQKPSQRPTRSRNVRVLLSHNDVCKGIISPIPVYLPNSGGCDQLCEAWTVMLTNGRGLQPGDSGSLVIDQETNVPYGHVIAVTPIGTIYVIPLIHTLSQVRVALDISKVELFSCVWSDQNRRTAGSSRPSSNGLHWLNKISTWLLMVKPSNSHEQPHATYGKPDSANPSGSPASPGPRHGVASLGSGAQPLEDDLNDRLIFAYGSEPPGNKPKHYYL